MVSFRLPEPGENFASGDVDAVNSIQAASLEINQLNSLGMFDENSQDNDKIMSQRLHWNKTIS